MSIVTPSEFRAVLGVSSSLYSDSYLQKIIDTSELTILPLLVSYSSAVTYHKRTNAVATLTTITPHNYVVGSSAVVSIGHQNFDGTKTVTAVPNPYQFSYSSSGSDLENNAVIPNGVTYLSGYNAATIYASNPAVYQAIMVISVEIFQSVTAAGGQIEGIDFQSTPYRMGRGLFNRVVGILGQSVDTGVWIG